MLANSNITGSGSGFSAVTPVKKEVQEKGYDAKLHVYAIRMLAELEDAQKEVSFFFDACLGSYYQPQPIMLPAVFGSPCLQIDADDSMTNGGLKAE
jgi:hypothetical protein